MPAYVPNSAVAINPGDHVILSNSALASPFKSNAVAVAPVMAESYATLTINNLSAVSIVIQYAVVDTDASYTPLVNGNSGTSLVVAANSSSLFSCGNGFIRAVFASTPGTSLVTITR